MSNIWTYQGEVGKRLDATVRPFDPGSPRFRFPTLSVDRCTWFLRLDDFIPEGVVHPEEGQNVSFFRSGKRFFHGQTLRPDQEGFTIGIEVVGPWHWMERIPLSKAVTLDAASGGGSGQRATIGFPAQNMSISLGTLIDRCIELGVPMKKGTIATCFNCIPITLNSGSCAQALSKLVQLIGDMAVAFDYSGPGLPVINITRRLSGLAIGSAEVITLDVEDLADGQFKVTPVDDQRVTQVRVPYIDRAADGTRRMQEQKAGTAETGHVLLLTASGEENDTFLPKDKAESYLLKTVATSGSAFKNWVLGQDGDVVNAASIAGVLPSALPLLIGPATLTYATFSSDLPAMDKSVPIPATSFTDEAGNAVSTAGKSLLVGDQLPEWLKASYTVTPVKVTGAIYYDFKWKQSSPFQTFPKPNWWYSITWSSADSEGFRGISSSYTSWELFIHTFEIRGYLINATAPGGTTVYKPADYVFISPPAGFAEGLLDARNWTPHVGTVGWKDQDCGEQRYLGKVINVTGADPSFATMRAMVQSEELDLDAGTTRLTLGPPGRHQWNTLLNSTPAFSAQQIVYL